MPQGYIFSSWIVIDLRSRCTTLWEDAIHFFFSKKDWGFHILAFILSFIWSVSCFLGIQSFLGLLSNYQWLYIISVFCDWVTSLRMIFSSSIHLPRNFIKSLFLIAEWYSIVYMHNFCINSFVERIWVLSSF